MRHAKSSWSAGVSSDHARPLNARGRRDAPSMADRIAEVGWSPEVAVVSDAARTEETWAWMADRLNDCRMVPVGALYHGTLDDIVDAVSTHHGGAGTVLALGHNPGWEEAIEQLSGQLVRMKTATVALLAHPEPWAQALQRSDWRLEGLLSPP